MRKLIAALVWITLMALLVAPARAQESPKPTMANNVILMGWDGCHRDHVKALLKEGKLPNLQKLIDAGTMVDVDVTSGATDTKAGWSQILTGYCPAVTGVYSNGRYRDIPAGYSIFERLRAQFGADQIATVAVIGKKGHCGEVNAPFKKPLESAEDDAQAKPGKKGKRNATAKRQPGFKEAPLGRVVVEDGKKYRVFDGSPYYTMHNNVDEWHFGLMEDEKVGDKALEMLDKYGRKPFFFFVHCAEVDHNGHRHGEKSKEYDDAIISGDRQLGRLVAKLKEVGVADKTLIYVTADHGFDLDAHQHRNAPYVFLATNDKQVMRNGVRADITPTILARLGVDLGKITPPLDGEPLIRPATKPIAKAEDNPDLKEKQEKPQTPAKRKRAKAQA